MLQTTQQNQTVLHRWHKKQKLTIKTNKNHQSIPQTKIKTGISNDKLEIKQPHINKHANDYKQSSHRNE